MLLVSWTVPIALGVAIRSVCPGLASVQAALWRCAARDLDTVSSHLRPGAKGTFWLDLAAVLLLVGGLNLVVWSGFVGGWVLAGVALVRLVLSVGYRQVVRRRDRGPTE